MTTRRHALDPADDPDELSRVGRRLQDAVTNAQRAAIDEAVTRALAATRRQFRKTYWWSVGAAFLVALAICLPISAVGYVRGTTASSDAASLAATGELTGSRERNLRLIREDLAAANNNLAAAGLSPVPDPGPDATSVELAAVVGEARGTLRGLAEVAQRGVPLPGLRLPDPRSGEFPSLRR